MGLKPPPKQFIKTPIVGTKFTILISSAKGGVGKSTVAVNLALSLRDIGLKVGLLDLDIYGPSLPMILGLDEQPKLNEERKLIPLDNLNMKVMSFGFISGNQSPTIWRGPLVARMTEQFFYDVIWGELDYLLIDFPPGTSDEPLTVAQSLPDIDGMVIVTTPQDVALMDSRKSIGFAESLKVPVLGVVENMSGYTIQGKASANSKVEISGPGGKVITSDTDENGNFSVVIDIFKKGGGKNTAEEFSVPYLGALPFDPGFVRGGDDGVHRIVSDPEGHSAKAFSEVVAAIQEQIGASESTGLEII